MILYEYYNIKHRATIRIKCGPFVQMARPNNKPNELPLCASFKLAVTATSNQVQWIRALKLGGTTLSSTLFFTHYT